ncbi:hypothetical protein A9Q99_21570 [Gammaproteobacteria bacterium 45_16_T64]|nr:hypothetical protein A9Q99_21570 [Gammaproteobacteria bacterium 45_16_T64]
MSDRDQNFDHMAERFSKHIYGGKKGAIRLAVLSRDLVRGLPFDSPISVLDAGGGLGYAGIEQAKQGHDVLLCDISEEMVKRATVLAGEEGVSELMRCEHLSAQKAAESYPEQFDLLLFHAVLEWMNSPKESLKQVLGAVKSEGYCSLMFFNVHSIIHSNMIRGNLRKVKSGQFGGDGKGLTPINPLDPHDVLAWLECWGWEVVLQSGVRVFYDNMPNASQSTISLEDILELELAYSQMEPYRYLGRYIHVLCKRKASS